MQQPSHIGLVEVILLEFSRV